MKNKINKFVYWAPRILSIMFILFLAVFSLDVFDSQSGFWGTVAGLLMHNIPVFILAILLWISWKREIVGGAAFLLAGLLYLAGILINVIKYGFEWYYFAWAIQISGIAFFIGAMFLVCWFKKKKLLKTA